LLAPFRETTNLNKHLRIHAEFNAWLKLYNISYKRVKSTMIDDKLFRLIKYIVSSNVSLSELENDLFIDILDPAIRCPSYHVFRQNLLPSVMQKFHEAIQNKLNSGLSICLIVDMWTNRSNKAFLALSASILNREFEKELFVIGMENISFQQHNAECLKQIIELIINRFRFNKAKIHCKLTYSIKMIIF
jgi:hypothetical protein